MVAPRIPFMQIRTLGWDRSKFLKGHVVNVPTDIEKMVNVLPRRPEEMDIIQINLKRRERNGPYLTDIVRPSRIKQALNYLIKTPQYIKEGIKIDWAKLHAPDVDDSVPFFVDVNDERRLSCSGNVAENEANDENEEQETEVHTMLYNNNAASTVAEATATFIAGEGNKPLSFIKDKFVEELSFPTIYHGRPRPSPTNRNNLRKASFSSIIKFELLYYKRHCRRPDKLFFDFKLKQTLEMFDSISLCVRQKRIGNSSIHVRDLLDATAVRELVKVDNAFSFMKNMRSSPAFWHEERQKLFAMIRQLGVPTFFITLSSADGKWVELISILGKILYGKNYSDEDVFNMSSANKMKLVREDPVTVVRYFDNRVRLMFSLMRQKGAANRIFPDHEVIHHYYRVEFQHRGAPHLHSVVYLKNAPLFDGTNTTECETFIDKFVSASRSNVHISDLIKYQVHTHTPIRAAKFNNGNSSKRRRVVDMEFPFFPIRGTRILGPIVSREDNDVDDDSAINREQAKRDLKIVREYLDGRSAATEEDDVSFDDLLFKLSLSERRYIDAIRSDLTKYKVFLKRDVVDSFVNPYNPNILELHKANMDIQFIVDPYNCVSYIVNYINKSDRGLSKLMVEAQAHIRNGDLNTKEKLRRLGNVFLGSCEVSAQEAAYHTVGLRLTNCSVGHVFVNTFPPEQRVKMAKSKAHLRSMDGACGDVFVKGMLEHYVQRPDVLEELTLARFATEYSYFNFTRNKTNPPADAHVLKDKSGYVRKLSNDTRKILRFRGYRFLSDPDNFHRENLMLFVPWRNEERDLLHTSERLKGDYVRNAERIKIERPIFVSAEQDDYERLAEDVRKRQSSDVERADVEEELPQDAVYYGGDAVPDDHDPLEGLSDYTAADQQSGAETCRNERRRRRSFQKAERFRQT
ncbi:uncharacterized protein LOC116168369 [Photinus pyralis]|uniref:uncharacterized protein LOC116168369 n=1 Tax=Photinus pyralis TaxID=7054 RepID=UPI00126737DB|nr:uncharacterized protein LOC116168369 [Photinus pyralis]XP_031340035.1 uncharacterized protein LOC116168369 [Photinus pyralis]